MLVMLSLPKSPDRTTSKSLLPSPQPIQINIGVLYLPPHLPIHPRHLPHQPLLLLPALDADPVLAQLGRQTPQPLLRPRPGIPQVRRVPPQRGDGVQRVHLPAQRPQRRLGVDVCALGLEGDGRGVELDGAGDGAVLGLEAADEAGQDGVVVCQQGREGGERGEAGGRHGGLGLGFAVREGREGRREGWDVSVEVGRVRGRVDDAREVERLGAQVRRQEGGEVREEGVEVREQGAGEQEVG